MLENLADLVERSADRDGAAPALRFKDSTLSYDELRSEIAVFGRGLLGLGLDRGERVAVFCDKRLETIVAMFGTAFAGGTFVPVNALLKPRQVTYILRDCDVRILVTTTSRLAQLSELLTECPALVAVVIVDGPVPDYGLTVSATTYADTTERGEGAAGAKRHRVIASDMAAIMYTSGSTGMPKGVVLSHANMLVGASSVASYIGNTPDDRILAVLPLSFDAGLSQVTTGFHAGACIVLHNYLLARDVVRVVERERITGITAVPPLWIQISEQAWPEGSTDSLRYFANTGGKMPREILARLRRLFPAALPFLMYGLTEAFRSTYLPPSEVDRRPDSIGKAIPNAEILVVNPDGSPCRPGEVGELVHRGPLVALGYWNDRERTAKRFRPAPGQPGGLPVPELAVWSGDSVRLDEDGFLYFVGRMDEMIKTSGYRVSPAEIEETAFETGLVSEVAAIGLPHEQLGQAIVLVARPAGGEGGDADALIEAIRPLVPNYMVPAAIVWRDVLPRNANGKFDRRALAEEFEGMFA